MFKYTAPLGNSNRSKTVSRSKVPQGPTSIKKISGGCTLNLNPRSFNCTTELPITMFVSSQTISRVISSVGYQDNILSALQKGARHFVQKPVKPEAFYEIIRYVLSENSEPSRTAEVEAQS